LGAAYTLWMVKRVVYGKIGNDQVAALKDIGGREFSMLAVMALFVLAMGVYPKPVVDVLHVSVANLLEHVMLSKIPLAP
jgi:NADH-quinone oxidoreductase subunit M